MVVVETYSVTERRDAGGYCDFEITFFEAGQGERDLQGSSPQPRPGDAARKSGRVMKRNLIAASILTLLSAQGVSRQDYFACKHDVVRHCSNAGDLSGAVSCLRGKMAAITSACRGALARHGF